MSGRVRINQNQITSTSTTTTTTTVAIAISVLVDGSVVYENNSINSVITYLNGLTITAPTTVRFNTTATHQPTGGLWTLNYSNGANLFSVIAASGVSPTIDGQLLDDSVIVISMSNVLWDGVDVINAFTSNTDAGGTIIRLSGNQSNITIQNCLLKLGFVGIRGTTDIDDLTIDNVVVQEVNGGSIRLGGGSFPDPDMFEDFDLRTSADYDMHNLVVTNITALDTLSGGNVPNTTQKFNNLIILKQTENITVENINSDGNDAALIVEGSSNLLINALVAPNLNNYGISVIGTDIVNISNNFLQSKVGTAINLVYIDVARNLTIVQNTVVGKNEFDSVVMVNLRRILLVAGNLFSGDYYSFYSFSIATDINGVTYEGSMAEDFQAENNNVIWNNNEFENSLFVGNVLSAGTADLAVRVSNTFGGAILVATYQSTYSGYGVNSSFLDTGFVSLTTRTNPDSSTSPPYYLGASAPSSEGRNMIASQVSSLAVIDAAGYYRVYSTDAGAFDRDATSTTPPVTTSTTTTTTTTEPTTSTTTTTTTTEPPVTTSTTTTTTTAAATTSTTTTTTTASGGILIGYVQAEPVPSFIGDCSTTFTDVLCTVPIYMANTGELGNSNVYSLGQLPVNDAFPDAGVPFYTDSALTTKLAPQGGKVYGFNTNNNGVPNRKLRIVSGTPNDYDGWDICEVVAYGYYVVSGTKVNVGNTDRAYTASDDSLTPYVGQRLFSSAGGGFFSNGDTIAWAASPNVTATHLITFGSFTTVTAVS